MILDTSAVIERVRARKPVTEDITAVTLVEYPKIIYYRHFSGGVVFPVYEDYIVAHRLQLALIGLGKPQALPPSGGRGDKPRRGAGYERQ
ncbi:MAG: hypothetical protein ACO2PN_20875 [Pyrobaculum sp.]